MVTKFGMLGVLAVLLVSPALAHAYIDPSAGQSLLQILIGVAVAGGVFFRVWFKWIARLFSRGAAKSEETMDDR